jgi:hypothetical protein
MSGENIPAIESALATFVVNPEPYLIHCELQLNLRALAVKLQILPVWLDMGGCLGVQPDGNVVSFLWDEPDQLRKETDKRIRNMVYYQGSCKFPELAELAPSRPPSAETCSHCGGTGKVSFPKEADEAPELSVVCFCSGLGWLPAKS